MMARYCSQGTYRRLFPLRMTMGPIPCVPGRGLPHAQALRGPKGARVAGASLPVGALATRAPSPALVPSAQVEATLHLQVLLLGLLLLGGQGDEPARQEAQGDGDDPRVLQGEDGGRVLQDVHLDGG